MTNTSDTPQSLRVLLVEDNPDDAKMVLRELKLAGFEAISQRVDTETAFVGGLHGDLDFILCDYGLPGFNGMRALELLKESGLEIPFILVSGSIGEDIAVEAMKQGAADYLLKDRLVRLGPAVHHALEQARLRKERQQAQEALRTTHTQLRQLLEHSPAVLYALKVERQSVVPHLVSESITALLGFTLPEALHYEWWMGQLHPEDRDRAVASISETLSQGASLTEYRLRHKDGTYRWVEDKRRLIRDSSNQPAEIVGIWADITERKRAEEVLLKSSRQKVGRQKARILWDLAVIFGLAVAAWVFCYNTDILVPPLKKLVFQFKDNIDDLLGPPVILLVGFLVFSYRRWRDAHNQFTEQAGVEEALRTLHGELENRIQLRTAELTKANDTLRMEAAEREKAKETIRQSEERFRQLAENITDVFWICSPDLQKVLYVSPAYEKIWGRSAARLADHPLEWGEAILPEDREGVFATYARLTTGEPSVKLEYRITRSDGEVRWMHSRGFQVRDVAGKVIRVAGVARDITESKKAEEAIRQSEERFRELAQNINEVFWMTNPAMTEILYVSPAHEKIWGQSCESLYVSPRSWLEAIHSEDRDRVTTSLAQALTKGGYSLEYRIRRKDGTCRWVEDHNRVVRDAEGKPTRLVGVWSDITDQKRVHEEIQNQLLELQRWHEAMLGREERILGLKCEVSRGQNPLAQGLARRRRVRLEKILLKLAS